MLKSFKTRFDPANKITAEKFRALAGCISDEAEIYFSEVAVPDAVAEDGTPYEDVRFLQFTVFKFHPRFTKGPSEFYAESESIKQD
jgi:hypothetical protein